MKALLIMLVGVTVHAAPPCPNSTIERKICVSSTTDAYCAVTDISDSTLLARIKSSVIAAYTNAPPFVQNYMCEAQRIGVTGVPGKSSWLLANSTVSVFHFGLNIRNFEENRNLTDLLYHDLNLLLESPTDGFESETVLRDFYNLNWPQPLFTSSHDTMAMRILFLLGHETGHILSWRNQNFSSVECDDIRCRDPLTTHHFGQYSWTNMGNGTDFSLINPDNELIRYPTLTPIAQTDLDGIDQYLDRLNTSDFTFVFSTKNPEEEFCEWVAFYTLSYSVSDLSVNLRDGSAFNLLSKVRAPASCSPLEKKLEFFRTHF